MAALSPAMAQMPTPQFVRPDMIKPDPSIKDRIQEKVTAPVVMGTVSAPDAMPSLTGSCSAIAMYLVSKAGKYEGMKFVPNFRREAKATGTLASGCTYKFDLSGMPGGAVQILGELMVTALYQGTYGGPAPNITSAESPYFKLSLQGPTKVDLKLNHQFVK
ncbi:hypothetical protein KBY96_12110 [Cyanobium sp. ATX 6A2]|uniref:hypothetical protein n=1 Tax=Cyanobium sp. ATX 6A2 TaxID=2823700 RepID=UPI0020CE0CF2|nr:hypothetical protein [Cyanobium sp. ATX 6A2]MCP9888666.1 hypothetical protein [Cyanobium sp. ATX 6A2]